MPDGKSPDLPKPNIASGRLLKEMRNDVGNILGRLSPFESKTLPPAIPSGASVPTLESAIKQQKPPNEVASSEIITPQSSVTDFIGAVKSGNVEEIAKASSRLSEVQQATEEPFKREEHLYVAYNDASLNPAEWSINKLRTQVEVLKRLEKSGRDLTMLEKRDLDIFRGLIEQRLPGREIEEHGSVDFEDYDQVEHYIAGLRKERVKIFDEAQAIAKEEFDHKMKTDPAARAREAEKEKDRLEALRQERIKRRQIRIDKAHAAGDTDYHEDPVPALEFNPEEFEPRFQSLSESELRSKYFRPEDEVRLRAVDTKIEKFAFQNEERIEFLASPERGRQIAREIMHWEGMRKTGSYKEIDWEALDKAYRDQIIHTEAIRIMGLRVPTGEGGHDSEEGGHGEASKQDHRLPVEVDKLEGLDIGDLYRKVFNGEELDKEIYKQIDIFFEQAKRAGVLEDMDKTLTNVYKDVVRGIRQGLSVRDILGGGPGNLGIDRELEAAEQITQDIVSLRKKYEEGSGLDHLIGSVPDGRGGEVQVGVWNLYALLAKERMKMAVDLKDEEQASAIREYTKHEFNLDNVQLGEERFWRPSPGGWSIEVYAKTPEEYLIAADTYIADAQARTSDPSEVFQDVTQFIKQIDMSTGHQSAEFLARLKETTGRSDKTDAELIAEFRASLTTLMQARIGVKIADHANELYHGSQYKQGMDFMAKDGQGPARWLALMELPGVAEALWKLDNDPRYEMMFALYGTHGQLASDSVAMMNRTGGLFNQVEHVLVEELLGTRILNQSDLAKTAKDMPESKFVEMFGGLYEYGKIPRGRFQGDGNIEVYRKYGELNEREVIKQVPKKLREAYHLGRIQHLMRPTNPTDGGEPGMGLSHHALTKADQRRLVEAEANVKKAVHIAMEIYGALGEKSKRGGGVFKVYRGRDKEGREIYDYVSTHQAEKFVQFAETMTEIKYADDSDVWADIESMRNDAIGRNIRRGGNFKARYRAAKVAQARRKALDEFAGEEKNLKWDPATGDFERDASGKYKLSDLTEEDRIILSRPVKNLSQEQRERLRTINIVREGGKGYEAKLYEYDDKGNRLGEMRLDRPFDIFDPKTGKQRAAKIGDVIGYTRDGREVTLQFDRNGRLQNVDYDDDGKAILYRSKDIKDRSETDRRKLIGERVNMHLTSLTGAEFKKLPVLDKDGELEYRDVLVEKAVVDFATASSHMYGDWTSHTYWSYQEEDRAFLLSAESFAEARQIRAGTLRPEDASIWGRQLLLVDPTLLRVMKFAKSKGEDHERKLSMAAVEHKYQSHWRIARELHHAFFPTTGSPSEFNGLYYGLQDFGGYRKMLESARAQIGEDPERFARRGKRLIPDLHIPYAAASEMWGSGTKGIMGVMRMFNAPVYRAIGTMALDKFSAQSDAANKMRSALVESRNSSGGYEEALLLKPTNNSDKASASLISLIPRALHEAHDHIKTIYKRIDWREASRGRYSAVLKTQSDFAYAIIESLGRYKTYMQQFPLIETGIRNAPGAFWFASTQRSAKDIFIDDVKDPGKLDRNISSVRERMERLPVIVRSEGEIWNRKQLEAFDRQKRDLEYFIDLTMSPHLNRAELDNSKSPDTGSSRHSGRIIHEIFGDFLVEQGFRGGGELYSGERFVYSRIFDRWLQPNEEGFEEETNQTIWDFILTKLIPT